MQVCKVHFFFSRSLRTRFLVKCCTKYESAQSRLVLDLFFIAITFKGSLCLLCEAMCEIWQLKTITLSSVQSSLYVVFGIQKHMHNNPLPLKQDF